MKLRLLFFTLLATLSILAKSQGSNCLGADGFCTGTSYNFPNSTSSGDLGNIGCLGSSPNPAWYYLEISTPGDLNIHIEQTDATGSGIDVDFICWGPFSSLSAGCAGGIPAGSGVDCSFSASAVEDCYIPGAAAGDIYILLLTNYSNDPGTIDFSQNSGTGATDCSVVCGVTGFTAVPGACNPATNQYSVSGLFSISNPPATGTLTFTNSCGGAPVVVSAPFPGSIPYSFSGLTATGAGCTVSATFSADGTCNSTVNYTAPPPCTPGCVINNFTANLSAPNCGGPGGDTYDIVGVVQTTAPPATGTLTVSSSCGGSQVFNAPFAATINYLLSGLNANGAPCTITAVYSASPACTQTINFTAPTCPCNMDFLGVTIGTCNTATNTYSVDVDLQFTSPPATGVLNVTVCGTTLTFNPPFVSPMAVTFSGLPTGVGVCNVNATFSASPSCTISNTYNAPFDCNCPADAGTYTTSLTGSGTTNYVLCENDQIDITYNLDGTPPNLYTDPTDPAPPAYNPGVWILVFSCPPTVVPPNDILADPCFLGIAPFTDDNGNMTDVNDLFIINSYPAGTFTDNTVYYVPITMYDVTTGTYSYYIAPNNCYDLGAPIAVTYLPPITATGVENCAAQSVTVTVNGGHPEIFATQFTASNLSPASASFVNTTCGDGGTIVINGLLDGDNYSFDITDQNGCPHTFSGGPFNGPATANINPAGPFCGSEAPLNLSASVPGGTWSGPGITNSNAGTFDPAVAGTGTHNIIYLLPGCALPDTIQIQVGGLAINNIAVTNITCNGDNDGSIVITCPTANQFSIDGGTTFQASNTFSNLAPGTYNIKVQTPAGCTATGTATVTQPLPLQITATTITNESCIGTCNGQIGSNVVGGTTPYATVTWFGPVSNSGSTLNSACSGVYTATVTDANGCSANDTAVITGPPPPPVTFTVDTTQGCLPLVVHFTNTMPAGTVLFSNWEFGDGTTSNTLNPLHVYNSAGCFDVTLTIQTVNGCNIDTTLTSVACAFNNPVADFTFNPNPADVFNPEVNFTNLTIGGISYGWDFDSLGTSTQVDPVFTFPNDSGSVYTVCLSTISVDGCIDTTCKLVPIQSVFLLYVPNTFTPDGDGTNDVFLPVLQGEDPVTYELYIFNRWGDLIFLSNNKLVGWDGLHNSIKAKEDVYVWKIRVRKDVNQEKVERYGHILLLR